MKRFLRYVAVTLPTFLLDLGLLVLLTQVFSVNYVLATGIAFIVATTANYFLSRRFVFMGSHRSFSLGYVYFLTIALVGLFTVTSSIWVLVGLLHFNYILSRLLIAFVEGMWNYLMNLYLNFKVSGKPVSEVNA
ncbi:GtrA family protein [Patescibacteria group bacterium]|nr:GtrA family protein [Patescibacteria group bacterium]